MFFKPQWLQGTEGGQISFLILMRIKGRPGKLCILLRSQT